MKRQSYHNAKQNSDYQYSDGEDQHFSHRNQSYEKRSRHFNGGAPFHMSDNDGARYQRYDSHQNSIMNKDQNRVAKIAIFYKNDDSLFQGIPMAVSRKNFPEFKSLLTELNKKIPLPNGVRFIFHRHDANKIESVDDIQGGEEYVVSSKNKFNRKINYGAFSPSKPGSHMQRSQGPSREHNMSNRQRNYPLPVNGSPNQPHQSQNNKPLRFRIINNTYRSLSDRMIVNPNTEETFEQLLANMGEVVSIMDGPPTAMFLATPPYKEITSFSSLKQELVSHNRTMFGTEIPKGSDEPLCEFFICDNKGPPREVLQKAMRAKQSSYGEDSNNDDPYGNSNDDSYARKANMEYENTQERGRKAREGSPPRRQQHQRNSNGNINGYPDSPRRVEDNKKFTRAPPINRERDQDSNKRYSSPPRNNNRQADQRIARQNERNVSKPTRNNVQQRSPDRQTRKQHNQQQNHYSNGAVTRRESDYQEGSPQENRRRQERSPPESNRRQERSPPESNRRQERSPQERHTRQEKSPPRGRREQDQHVHDPMDEQDIDDRRVRESRDDDDMDHDGNEDDDEYDDDSDGPGEPRAARKGPRIETPEF